MHRQPGLAPEVECWVEAGVGLWAQSQTPVPAPLFLDRSPSSAAEGNLARNVILLTCQRSDLYTEQSCPLAEAALLWPMMPHVCPPSAAQM